MNDEKIKVQQQADGVQTSAYSGYYKIQQTHGVL